MRAAPRIERDNVSFVVARTLVFVKARSLRSLTFAVGGGVFCVGNDHGGGVGGVGGVGGLGGGVVQADFPGVLLRPNVVAAVIAIIAVAAKDAHFNLLLHAAAPNGATEVASGGNNHVNNTPDLAARHERIGGSLQGRRVARADDGGAAPVQCRPAPSEARRIFNEARAKRVKRVKRIENNVSLVVARICFSSSSKLARFAHLLSINAASRPTSCLMDKSPVCAATFASLKPS